MRAIVMDHFGGSDVLHQADIPVPKPADGELLIQVVYTAVNPIDWKIREGLFKDLLPYQFPLILGWDVSGVVISVGPHVSLFKPNDRVYAYCRKPIVQMGAYAEFMTLHETLAARMPKNLGFRDAAAIPLAGLTAWQALFDHAQLKAGETILIHAGAGGVGSYAIQMAHNAGAGVITTASLRNHDLVRSLGAMQVIDYAREDIVKATRGYAPQGVDVVFDLLGGETQEKSFAVLKPGGRLICAVTPPDEALVKRYNVTAVLIGTEPNNQQLSDMATQFDDGRLKVPPIREYDLKDAAAAQSLSQTGHVQGKIVLKVK
jgi:NADPH:quinone reductase-like Zn-dependent oxidoreductase